MDNVFRTNIVVPAPLWLIKYDRYYLPGDDPVAHLAPYGGGKELICGLNLADDFSHSDDDLLGTGTQQEWDFARRLDICPNCLGIAETLK